MSSVLLCIFGRCPNRKFSWDIFINYPSKSKHDHINITKNQKGSQLVWLVISNHSLNRYWHKFLSIMAKLTTQLQLRNWNTSKHILNSKDHYLELMDQMNPSQKFLKYSCYAIGRTIKIWLLSPPMPRLLQHLQLWLHEALTFGLGPLQLSRTGSSRIYIPKQLTWNVNDINLIVNSITNIRPINSSWQWSV